MTVKSLLSTLLVLCSLDHADAVGARYTTQSKADPWQKNWALMFDRTEPRFFARYPEDVHELLQQSEGFYTQLNSTTIYQAASKTLTDRDQLLNTTYHFSGAWMPFDRSLISWEFTGGQQIGEPQDANLSTDIGSVLDVNGSLEEKSLYLNELHWAQDVGTRLRYSLGFIDSSNRYDFNEAANDEAFNFIAGSLVNSPAIPFPDRSLAIDALFLFDRSTGVHAGIYQNNCGKTDFPCTTELDSDHWLLPVELVVASEISGWGEGHYRFLIFTTRSGGNSGEGFSISFDQNIGRFTPFLRVSSADQNITDIKRFLSMGLLVRSLLYRPQDAIGIAMARGEPSDATQRTETLFEVFWRFQLNPYVNLTPDLQLVIDPSDNPGEDSIYVAGLRMQLDF